MKTEIRKVQLADWKPAPYNPREISEEALAGLGASLDRFGLVEPIVVNARTKRIVGGHQRAKAMEAAGRTECDAVVVNLDETDEKALNLTLNNPKIAGDWTDGALPLLGELEDGLGAAFGDLGLDSLQDSLAELFPSDPEEPPPEDEVPEPPADPVTKLGDVWTLGDHRLVCGDSTDAAVLALATGGEQAAMMATDPPYGVSYGVETGGDNYDPIANDENDGPRLQAFLERVFSSAKLCLRGNAAWYLWHAQLTQGHFAAAAAAADVLIHRQIIWVKPSLVLGHGDFHWRHELCFYGWRQGHRAEWFGDRSQTTVWEVGRENDGVHPTQKPVELFARPMRLNTRPGEVCLEPFAGSGSQVIAGEHTERRVAAIELDPAYCDVIVERWQNLTGGKATR